MKSGNLNFLEPSGSLQACKGTVLPLLKYLQIKAPDGSGRMNEIKDEKICGRFLKKR